MNVYIRMLLDGSNALARLFVGLGMIYTLFRFEVIESIVLLWFYFILVFLWAIHAMISDWNRFSNLKQSETEGMK